MNPPLVDANGFYLYNGGSNIRQGTNPPYDTTDFLMMYPQFGNDANGNAVVPTVVIQNFLTMANAALLQVRWRNAWVIGMGLYIAHYCQMWIETSVPVGSVAVVVAEQGKAEGVVSDKSVGDIHIGFDTNLAGREAPTGEGWGAWHLTKYGQQFRTLAKMYGMGGMYVY